MAKRWKELRPCQRCGEKYTPRIALQKFCSIKCQKVSPSAFTENKLSNGTIGAIGELAAAAELMKIGWEVFRALSPSCSCDLAAIKDGKLYRFEVRTGYQHPKGRIAYSPYNVRAENVIVITYPFKMHLFPANPVPAA